MAIRGELVELLAKALNRARLGANDRGALERAAGFIRGTERTNNPQRDYVIRSQTRVSDDGGLAYHMGRTPEQAGAPGVPPHNPSALAQERWTDGPVLTFSPDFVPDDLRGLSRPNGELASPEEFLGRPLTPDHIWNDPRFQERMAKTRDLDGIRTPEERFRIAAEREQMAQSGPRGVASARWGVDNPVVKMLLLGGAGAGGAMTLREVLANRMSA